jgi:phage-related protein
LSVPYTVPFTVDSLVVPGTVSLTNPGNATGPVVLRIDGPVTGPQVTHVASGLTLTFETTLQLVSGDWLTVDMEQQTALQNDQASRNSFISDRGWSGFDPGDNTWAFAAQSGAGLLTVTATPAWL